MNTDSLEKVITDRKLLMRVRGILIGDITGGDVARSVIA